MGNPFTGYVRPPGSEPNVTQADVDAAIRRAAVSYNVPVDVLRRVNAVETGSTANAAQVVGFNSSGYGGLFGLPKSLLGNVQEQANSAAATLAGAFTATGSWDAAVRRYSGGGYGFDGSPQPPDFGLSRAKLDAIFAFLDQLALRTQLAQNNPNRIDAAQAASELKAKFPDVPVSTLRALTEVRANNPDLAAYFGNTFAGGAPADVKNTVTGAVETLTKTSETADSFRAWIENSLAPNNLWRAGFVLLGVVLVFGGARLYFQPSAEAGGRVREVASA